MNNHRENPPDFRADFVLFDAADTLFGMIPALDGLLAELTAAGTPDARASIRRSIVRIGSTQGWPPDQPDRGARNLAWGRFVEQVLKGIDLGPREPERRRDIARAAADVITDPESYRLFPEVTAVLTDLRSRDVPVAIVSNFDDLLFDILDHTGLTVHFPIVISSYRYGVSKPDPRIFEPAMAALRAHPDKTCYIGDSISTDMAGAKSASLQGILIDRENEYPDFSGLRISSLSGLEKFLD